MQHITALNPYRKTKLNEAISGRLNHAFIANHSELIDIVIHLKPIQSTQMRLTGQMEIAPSYQSLDEEMVGKIARRLKKKLNILFFGNAHTRYHKTIEFAAWHHSCPHNHLHIIAELPKRWMDNRFSISNRTFSEMEKCVAEFCEENSFCQPLKHFAFIRNIEAAVNYNSRFRANGRYVV